MSLDTSLGGRPQNVQTVSRFIERVRQTRVHQLPPASSTIC